jgi:ABC-type transport system substrate-binding protein
MFRSSRIPLLVTVVALVGAAIAFVPGGSARDGGVLRIVTPGVSSIDPAISIDAATELQPTCAQLMNYADKPLPAGLRLVPEVAARYPSVSRDGRTYTFTIRSTYRFNTGERVTAESFVRAIYRVLNPVMNSQWVQYVQDIVGAKAVLAGKTTYASGIRVRGNKLIIQLTDAARDFPARVTTYPFCAVPVDLPVDPEGVGAPLPGAGPYYIADFTPGRDVVLKRNPFYRGPRPHHVDEIDVSFVDSDETAVSQVESGQADFADVSSVNAFAGLDPKFRRQLLVVPGVGLRYIALNSSRPLFRNNVPLRQAVNFAIDRPALLHERGDSLGRVTDQYLPPSLPGFVDGRIYPLARPDVSRARTLARGHTRRGRAVLYVKDQPVDVAQAQIIQRDLRPIGIRVQIKRFPGPVLFQKLFTPGTPYDMALLGWSPDYFDPYDVLNILFDGRLIGTPVSFNLAYFSSPKYNGLLDGASRLTGAARYLAYGKLDVDLAANAAPIAAYSDENAFSFVSKRVGCVVLHPYLDLAAVCLK